MTEQVSRFFKVIAAFIQHAETDISLAELMFPKRALFNVDLEFLSVLFGDALCLFKEIGGFQIGSARQRLDARFL